MKSVSNLIRDLDVMIRASEDWSKQYSRDPESHARLIKSEASLDKALRKFFRDMGKDSSRFINWEAYNAHVKADSGLDVIVNVDTIGDFSQGLMKVMFDPLVASTFAGLAGGESIYNVPLGIQSTDAVIQQLTSQHVAGLVGKIIDKTTGLIVDNPKQGYSILDSVRNDILASIKTSIGLGLDNTEASDRIAQIIGNPNRAQLIAQTETVNAYSNGLQEFGKQSGAAGKEWQDVGADDVCSDNADLGPIEFGDSFLDSDGADISGPVAHPRCRCGLRLIYQKEWDELNK